ncbi:unnamed protein product [Linum trigynum]|uniref:RIN4 pathogenic type III effector avirulence factor Avr cleavage site domain-containing protein n=1 Tax=Linum trigynum TaxID=586398 RepID=A0AAV2EUB4_9ROSI
MAKAAGAQASEAGKDEGAPLPKFGEWDVNNPASAEGFTVIFNKARNEKKTKAGPVKINSQNANNNESPTFNKNQPYQPPESSRKNKWLCCG